ncbi:hypothetical protein POTOM_059031 [Populus tomentosa]|uniref:HNH nuclease domain-containing protein n=1 Tax=Populus tomentosa TaxID=118781 RepID=A0A8X7XTC4_POPTO|nr:hypothetical protein POTOM_059031 [Populus tomentosa]
MAQFTAQGRLKLLFNNGGTHCKLLGNDFLEASQSVSEASDESDEDYDSERDELACFRGLVLDISYSVAFAVEPQDGMGMSSGVCGPVIRGAASECCVLEACHVSGIHGEGWRDADVLEYYDQTVNSPSGSFYIPAVLRVPHLLQVVKRRRIFRSKLSRKNILHRDNYTCQYCSSHENLTIDHVLPTVQGGEWQWENLVTACAKCNSKKGKKTPEEANMKLSKVPKAPKDYDILAIPLTSAAIRMLTIRKGMPEEWLQYLARPSSEP